MAEQFNQIEPLNYKHRTVEAEVDEGEVAIFTARMGLKVDEARALRDWLNAALPDDGLLSALQQMEAVFGPGVDQFGDGAGAGEIEAVRNARAAIAKFTPVSGAQS